MEIRRIRWQQTIALRHAVLWPDKPPEFCHVEGDESAWHYGAFAPEGLISVASVYLEGPSARLRKFAIAPPFQRRGVGSAMLTRIVDDLKRSGAGRLWCDARESAVGFYERFGLKPVGERFYKGDVAYFKMNVQLM